MRRTPDIRRVLETLSYVLRGGTITDGHQTWTLVWPYGWWRVWLGDASLLREGDGQKWVTDFSDVITFNLLQYTRQCPEIAKIVQKVEEVPMNIVKILENMSALLRGKRLTVYVNMEPRFYFYDSANNTLHYEMPAVLVRPDEPPQASTYTCAAPNLPFGELVAILATGVINA